MSSRPSRVRARWRSSCRREVAHRAHGVVELADAGEPGRERDVAERQLGGLDEHPGRLGALRPRQRQRVRADLGLQQPLELAGGVADAGGQPGDALAVDGAVGDQPHRPGHDVAAHVPLRGTGRGVGPAALAGPEAGPLGGRRGRIEPHVAGERRPDRAAGPAVDLRRQHGGDEPAVEPGVLGLDGPVAAVEIVVHAIDNYTRATDITGGKPTSCDRRSRVTSVDTLRPVAQLVQQYLDRICAEHAGVTDGALADYIPELADVDPDGFALSLSSADGFVYESGDAATEFTIQSISKPFTYALALDQIGAAAVDAKIGVEPSGEAFNEISVDSTTKIPEESDDQRRGHHGGVADPGGRPRRAIRHDPAISTRRSPGAGSRSTTEVYASEKATGSRNRAIAYMLQSFGVLDDDPDEVLDVYFRQCSLRVTSTDLARMGATLARGGVNPQTGRRVTGRRGGASARCR